VHATQIAGLGAVPHHHRATARRNAVLAFMGLGFVTQLIPVIRGIHQELGNTDHNQKLFWECPKDRKITPEPEVI
jgi:hypothetical protein